MQRHVFIPTYMHLQKDANKLRKEESFKVLEVAGGTGRVMTFFRDNYPQMDATFLELSPFYLEEAKKNDDTFRRYFKRSDPRANNIEMKPLSLVQGRAEKMIFEDESFDILNCVYLFHELPHEVRKECAKEFFRVLRPGGLVAWNDSIQASDRSQLPKEVLEIFPKRYHEPYYMNYLEDDINAIFIEAGFEPGPCEPIIANRSKVMSWVKPGEYKVDSEMIMPEGSEQVKVPKTAFEEIKVKDNTRKENKKEYIKAKRAEMKEKAQAKKDSKKEDDKETESDPMGTAVEETKASDETNASVESPETETSEDKLNKAVSMTKEVVGAVKDVTYAFDEDEAKTETEPEVKTEAEETHDGGTSMDKDVVEGVVLDEEERTS